MALQQIWVPRSGSRPLRWRGCQNCNQPKLQPVEDPVLGNRVRSWGVLCSSRGGDGPRALACCPRGGGGCSGAGGAPCAAVGAAEIGLPINKGWLWPCFGVFWHAGGKCQQCGAAGTSAPRSVPPRAAAMASQSPQEGHGHIWGAHLGLASPPRRRLCRPYPIAQVSPKTPTWCAGGSGCKHGVAPAVAFTCGAGAHGNVAFSCLPCPAVGEGPKRAPGSEVTPDLSFPLARRTHRGVGNCLTTGRL